MRVYLDTSALVKRYFEESGTEIVDEFFEKAYKNEVFIVTSQWNIGEAAVVFDKYMQRGIKAAGRFFNLLQKEIYFLLKHDAFKIIPVYSTIIAESLPVIFRYHIYVADAIQITTFKKERCDLFLTFDKKLKKIAELEKIKTI